MPTTQSRLASLPTRGLSTSLGTGAASVIFILLSCAQLVHAEPSPRQKTIIDFSGPDVVKNITTNEGVSVKVVDGDQRKPRMLEVRIRPFSEHENKWPYVVFKRNGFCESGDFSNYSRISMRVHRVTETSATIELYGSTLPNDHGRNVEGKAFLIPGGTAMTCELPMSMFVTNDPSALNWFHLQFRPTETESVFRVEPVEAVYDKAGGSPAETLIKDLTALTRQFQRLKRTIRLESLAEDARSKVEGDLAAIGTRMQTMDEAARTMGTPQREISFHQLQGDYDASRQQLRQLSMADKQGLYVWEIDPYVNILRNELPDLDMKPVEKMEAGMALNEFRNGVLMASACGRDLKLAVSVETSAGLPPAAVEVFETRYLKNRKNQETGEPLYPLDSPLTILNQESRQITIRFNTRTQSISPGSHAFKVILRDLDAGTEKIIPGRLDVWDFALPDYDILPCNGYAELNSSEFHRGNLLPLAVADMKTFGMNIVTIREVYMPKVAEIDAEGNVTKIDSTAFERHLSQILKAWQAAPGREKPQFLFAFYGMYDLGVKGLDQPLPNARWQKALAQWLNAFTATLKKYDLTYADWFFALGDEANEAALINQEIPAAEGLKTADPNVRTINNTSTFLSDPAMTRRFYKAFDILQPHLPEFKSRPPLRAWIEQAGKPIWTYKCLVDWGAPGKNTYEYYRVYGWEMVQYGITGIGIWTYCTQAATQPGWGCIMVYKHADRDQVVHSRRFEFLREGMDDYRYIWKLQETAKAKNARAIKRTNQLIQEAVADVTSHPADTTRADHWRARIATEILKLQNHK